jgi:hypothetical protein
MIYNRSIESLTIVSDQRFPIITFAAESMSRGANFKVDPKLAHLLGEGYRSSEQALKELVDNAWDAEAKSVWIILPAPMTSDSIIVRDDGSGMTELEVRNEYLKIASDRRSRKGDRTPNLKRLVKGRKGIGKFSGLMVANIMELETSTRGKLTRLRISKAELEASANTRDLEKIELPLDTEEIQEDAHGTTITLRNLTDQFSFPSAEALKRLLVIEYGREDEFRIFVNHEQMTIEDVPGQSFIEKIETTNSIPAHLNFKVSEGPKPLKQSGIVLRVGGKTVGKPEYFGLEDDPEIPPKLLKKVYGELNADGLADSVTGDWGAVVENSKAYQELRPIVKEKLKEAVTSVYKREVNLARARLKQEIDRRLALLPEYRRNYAKTALERVLQRFYGESDERVEPIVSVVLDALERDEYWQVLQKIDDTKGQDVEAFAQALELFGLLDLALISRQADYRRQILDRLDELVSNPATLEKIVHQVFEANLWVLGQDHAMISSNQTLAKVIEDYIGKEFTGERANKRPDLFLAERLTGGFLLVEFKRPSHILTRDDENQAIKYRDDLSRSFGKQFEILLLGRSRGVDVNPQYDPSMFKALGYTAVISSARTSLTWLLESLKRA